jgi:ankyrin repeat protein
LHWLAGSAEDTDPALHEYLADPNRKQDHKDELQSLRLLVAAGVGIDRINKVGRTALHLAAAHNDSVFAVGLLNAGAHINAVDADGVTALMLAVESGAINLVTHLLQRGATTENTTPTGLTALLASWDTTKVIAVAALLQAGANVHAVSHKYGNALSGAIDNGRLVPLTMVVWILWMSCYRPGQNAAHCVSMRSGRRPCAKP